jgi:TatD DNase family protein
MINENVGNKFRRLITFAANNPSHHMIDTHAHTYLPQFDKDMEEVVTRMRDCNVYKVYLPNIDVNSIARLKSLSANYPDIFLPMMGLHPCSVKGDYKDQLSIIREELYNGGYLAVGEIGIDLYWDKTFVKEQEETYREQIFWAEDLNLPYVVHSRDSLDSTIGISSEMQNGTHRGIFHCFNGTLEQAKKIIDIGFLMGIGGVVTFKNGGVDKVVADIPLKHLVLETDAPYLSPAPFRGKRNEPSYLTFIVDKIAGIKGISKEEVIEVTTRNAMNLFHPAK